MAKRRPTDAQLQAALKDYMRSLAAKGATLGGKARMSNLTAEEKSALGKKAAAARWKKKRTAR